jgi:hypothetical protein
MFVCPISLILPLVIEQWLCVCVHRCIYGTSTWRLARWCDVVLTDRGLILTSLNGERPGTQHIHNVELKVTSNDTVQQKCPVCATPFQSMSNWYTLPIYTDGEICRCYCQTTASVVWWGVYNWVAIIWPVQTLSYYLFVFQILHILTAIGNGTMTMCLCVHRNMYWASTWRLARCDEVQTERRAW